MVAGTCAVGACGNPQTSERAESDQFPPASEADIRTVAEAYNSTFLKDPVEACSLVAPGVREELEHEGGISCEDALSDAAKEIRDSVSPRVIKAASAAKVREVQIQGNQAIAIMEPIPKELLDEPADSPRAEWLFDPQRTLRLVRGEIHREGETEGASEQELEQKEASEEDESGESYEREREPEEPPEIVEQHGGWMMALGVRV
jgi:hypothetical protein